jgi:hypothetical protein
MRRDLALISRLPPGRRTERYAREHSQVDR